MGNVVVVGAQWGDEGKAKITDLLSKYANFITVSFIHHPGTVWMPVLSLPRFRQP